MMVYIWRHPKPIGAQGICLGQSDLPVDNRKIKRLANKIQRYVNRHQLPKVIWVSPLQRSLKVGQLLAQRGFECHVDASLAEMNFGAWDGNAWSQIPHEQIQSWCDNFAHFAPEGGESLAQLFTRVQHWLQAQKLNDTPTLIVGHAGWINVARIIANDQPMPDNAMHWPMPVAYCQLSSLKINVA